MVTAFGSGVPISTLAFNLMDEACGLGSFWTRPAGWGGFDPSTCGLLIGAAPFICLDWTVYRAGARFHKADGRRRGRKDLQADEAGRKWRWERGCRWRGRRHRCAPRGKAVGAAKRSGGGSSLATVAGFLLAFILAKLSA